MAEKLRQLQAELREREQAEEKLLQFRKLMDESSDAIFLIDLDSGRYIDFNKSAYEFLGYSRQELTELSVTDVAEHIPSLNVWHERVSLVRESGGLIFETRYRRKDQTIFPVEVSARLLDYEGRNIMVAVVRDIAARKEAEIALRESEARLRALLHALPDMILELSFDGTVINLIPPSDLETTMLPERFIGKPIDEIFGASVAAQTRFAAQRTSESGQISVFEFETELAGEACAMEARLIGSAPDTVLMMVRDISQRKWIEQEREKLIQELELKNAESETLRRSLASIAGTLEFTEVIDRVLEEIRQVIPYDTASVWRVEGREQYIITGVDLPPEIEIPGTVFVVDDSNSAYPLLMGTIPYVLNNNVQAELADFQEPPHTYVQSWLAIPMKTRGKIIGLIALDGKSRDQFTQHHAELAVNFANQLAIALDNVRLFAELQHDLKERRNLIAELERKKAEAETLRESTAIVAATLETSEAVKRLLEQLKRVVPYDSASVWLYEDMIAVMVGENGLPSDALAPASYEVNESEPDYALLNENLPYILLDDVQEKYPQFKVPSLEYIHSWLAIPLKARGQVTGFISLDSRIPGQFTEHDAKLALTYADQVSIALENARLFSGLQAELAGRKNLISELENKNAELERFTYTVSHDLKSPLFTIRGFLGYLEQDALSGDQARLKSDIQRITDATEKMQRLLNELLELSRVGRLKNEFTCFPLDELAREAAELVQGQLMARGVSLSIQEDLPVVCGDRPRLTEVLQNLFDNAAKFMGDQQQPCIEVGSAGKDAERDLMIFYVRDNGLGIAPEHHERVFGLFNKLDPKSDGTGIGLALVRRIVEVHGGTIWVDSEAGKGSTFYFSLRPPAQLPPDSVL